MSRRSPGTRRHPGPASSSSLEGQGNRDSSTEENFQSTGGPEGNVASDGQESQPQTSTEQLVRQSNISGRMHSTYNRVSVQDLLNADIAIVGNSSSGPAPEAWAVCNIGSCGRRFVSVQSLSAHQKRAHAAPTSLICSHCGSSFSTIPNLNKHVSSVLFEDEHDCGRLETNVKSFILTAFYFL